MSRRWKDLIKRRVYLGIVLILGLCSLSGVTVDPDPAKVHPVLMHTIDENAAASSGLDGFLLSIFQAKPSRTLLILADDDPSLGPKMAALGSDTVEISPGFHVGNVPVEAVRYLSNWPSIRYMEPSMQTRKMLDLSRPAVLADVVQNGTGAGLSGVPYTGIGSYVGAVDTGLYGSHLDFDDNGNPALPRVVARLGYPGFTPGSDTDGHGTHVMGIAAGNGFSSRGLYTGMAPGSRILSYTTTFDTADILSGINQLFSAAGNSPVSINLSLGLMEGSHDGTNLFESEVNRLATGPLGSKRLISVAAGNEGDMREHFQATVPALGGSVTVQVTVPTPKNGLPPGQIDVWASGSNDPARLAEHDEYFVTVAGPALSVSAASGHSATSSNNNLTLSNRVDTSVPNGATHISIIPNLSLRGSLLTITFTRTWAGSNGTLDAYLDAETVNEGFVPSTASGSIIEPANGDNVIAVGAWVTRSAPDNWGATGGLAQFSSQGPTRDGRSKPDMAAPGTNIYSARSPNASSIVPPYIVSANDNYAIMSGTSMAAPHITGIAALVWESNPSLTGAQLRERIRMSADGVGAIPNTSWGFGKINALRAVSSTIAAIQAPVRTDTGSSVSIDSSDSSGAFGNPLTFSWALSSKPVGSALSLTGSTPSVVVTPDIPGNYTFSLTATQTVPAGVPPATAFKTIHANRLPTPPIISGPATSDNNAPAQFSAFSSDPDGAPLSWYWVLVSKPAGSSAPLSGNGNTATLFPDISGSYVLGARSNDGTDNSVLAVHTFTSGGAIPPSGPPPTASHSSGGCNGSADPGQAQDWDMLLILLIVGVWLRAGSRPF